MLCVHIYLSSRRALDRRRRALCVVKEDGTEIGRTQASEIIGIAGDNAEMTGNDSKSSKTISGVSMPEMVSWEDAKHFDTNLFEVTLSPHRGGGLPLQLTVELWEVVLEDDVDDHTRSHLGPPAPNPSGDRRNTRNTSVRVGTEHSVRRIGSATIGPDTLVLSLPGRLTLPLKLSPSNPKGTIRGGEGVRNSMSPGRGVSQTTRSGGRAAGVDQATTVETTGEGDALPSTIILRVTPQVGLHWGRRVKAAAAIAKRVNAHPPPAASLASTIATESPIIGSMDSAAASLKSDSNGLAHVVYMTNAEGSARTWRARVTPGSSIPPQDYEDVLELVFGSVPACCPEAPTLLVAPVSDIGVQLGQVWIGPTIAARHAIVAHRPQHFQNNSSIGNEGDDETIKKHGMKATFMGDIDSIVAIEPPREDELFLRVVAAEAERLLRELRARDMRTEQRRMVLYRVREICEAWTQTRIKATASQHQAGSGVYNVDGERGGRHKSFSLTNVQEIASDRIDCDGDEEESPRKVRDGDGGYCGNEAEGVEEDEEEEEGDQDDDRLDGRAHGDLYRGVLRALEMALPGVSIYLGLLERGGESIRYVACTKQSSMAGKQLKKGEGISFSCVGPHYEPYVVYPPRRSGGLKRGHNSTPSQPKQPTQLEEEGLTAHRMPLSSSHPESTMAEIVDAATKAGSLSSASSKRPRAERSLEEIVVSIQKVFRGKMSRDRTERSQPPGASHNKKTSEMVPKNALNKSKKSALLIPKVFDYEGRVGWPFVCVPLEGFLRSSSIGVLGLDTFEQMGNSGGGKEQPETGVVQMVKEAAR